jgi:tryptophan 2,3-dioxygenase
MAQKPTPYWDYIRVDALLSLQAGISAEAELTNDEVMFIVVHQIDELWFKLILREMVAVRTLFARAPVPEQALASAVRGIRRMETILHQLAAHFALMETMTTRDYLAFRDKLTGASGFQSAQMREIEIVMGLPELERVPLGHEGSYLTALKEHDGTESPALKRVRARLADRPTLRGAVLEWVHRTPIQGSTSGRPTRSPRRGRTCSARTSRRRCARGPPGSAAPSSSSRATASCRSSRGRARSSTASPRSSRRSSSSASATRAWSNG